ncbi:biopolymer transporter ExbD [Oleiagrimonas sp. C23AA]|uniref:ExbD/TolR family protein n=1 Tax=Oleiagrimonas sp. C23AA TaxID=2719047 RepID=UPI00141E4A63|nr:biopolymer transporter ExbD [Oleiagrimonas sp. C23AA]NII10686.1 biopolymer transporter ExbD [Oleiagrimonas sp. C23AA]
MAFSSNSEGGAPMADINVTPLVDVMLVLLIIFMITAPMLTHKISIDLPQPTKNQKPPENPPAPIKLKITQNGSLYMNDTPVSESDLKLQLEVYAAKPVEKQPEIQIDANDNAEYDVVAKVLSDAKSVGMKKIGFLNTDQ